MPFDPNQPFEIKGFDPNQPYEVVEPERGRTVTEAITDTAIDTGVGIVNFGEGAVGVADLATGNLAGKGLSYLGYDPAATVQALSKGYSDPRKKANAEVAEAEGFWGKISALVDNPSVAFGTIVQSAPMAAGGAAVARTVATRMLGTALAENGIAAGSTAAKEFAKNFFADKAVQSTIVRAGAVAEGAQSAGLIQEEGRQAGREWSDTVIPAIAAGAGTAAIGVSSSKIPGFRDAEASIATAGLTAREAGGGVGKAIVQSAKEVGKSMVKEGALEEMPQSGWEEASRNVAMGKPTGEGVPEAMGEGLVVGAAQGGAMTTASEAINAVQPAQIIPIDKTKPSNMAVVAANISEADREHAEQTAMAERMAGLDSTIDGIDSKVAGKPVDFAKMKELPENAYTANRGRPFVSESALRAHARVKGVDLTGHEIVPFGGGFVGVPPQAQEETKQGGAQNESTGDDIPEWSMKPKGTQKPRKSLIENDPFSDDYDPDLHLKYRIDEIEAALRGQNDQESLDAIYDDVLMTVEKRPDLQPFAEQLHAAYAEHTADLAGRATAEAERSKAEARKNFPGTAGMSLDTEGGRHVDDKVKAQTAVRESKEKALMAKFGLKAFPDFDPANAPVSSEPAGASTPTQEELYSEADARKNFPGTAGMSLDTEGGRLVDTKVEAQTAVRASKEKALMAKFGLKAIPPLNTGGNENAEIDNGKTQEGDERDHVPNVERHETIDNADSAANAQVVNTAPSDAQKEAGNYKKAHVKLDGLDISVENPAGSVRSGTDKDGKTWQTEMKADYGYIKGSQGYDKDHVDVFMSPGYQGGAEYAYVVNQFGDNGKGDFDEHKVVLGANSEAEALKVYNSNYDAGWKGGKYVTAMPMEEFKEWAKSEEPQAGALMRNNTQAAHSLQEEMPQVAGKDQQAERNAFTGSKKEAILAQLRRRVGDERKEFPGTDKENLTVARAKGPENISLRGITTAEAKAKVAGNTEKPRGIDPATQIYEDIDYAEGIVPLSMIEPNEDGGERYDGTVNLDLAKEYAQRKGQFPPVVLAAGMGGKSLHVTDGGHRVTAARLRGDKAIRAIVGNVRTSNVRTSETPNIADPPGAETVTGAVSDGGPSNSTGNAPVRTVKGGEEGNRRDSDAVNSPLTDPAGALPALIEHMTKKGKVIKGIVRTDLTHAEAMDIDKYTFKKDGGWFIREEHLSAVGHPQGKRDGADSGADGIIQNSRQTHEGFPGWYYVVNHTLGTYKQRGKFKATFLQEKPNGDFFPANGFGDTAQQALDNAITELKAAQKGVEKKKEQDQAEVAVSENIGRLKEKLFEARRQAKAALKPEVKAKAEAKVEEIERDIRKARQGVFDEDPAQQANDEPTLIIHSLQTGKEEELKLPPRKKAEPEVTQQVTQTETEITGAISGQPEISGIPGDRTSTDSVTNAEGSEKPETFVRNRDGSEVFGNISRETGREAGEIRLQVGDDSHGKLHIENRHGKQLRESGYESVERFVGEIAQGYNEVYKGAKGSLIIAKRNGRDRIAYVKLEPVAGKPYYLVKSATFSNDRYLTGKELLWKAAHEPSTASTASTPNALADDAETSSLSGQNNPSSKNIAEEGREGKGDGSDNPEQLSTLDQVKALSEDDLDNLLDEVEQDRAQAKEKKTRQARERATTGRTSDPVAPKEPKAPRAPRTKTAKDIAREGGIAANAAIREATLGLSKLFGDPNTLRSGLVFDEDTYQKAKPHFVMAWNGFKDLGKSAKELVSYYYDMFGDGIRPYLKRFMRDLQDDNLEAENSQTQEGAEKAEKAGGPSADMKELKKIDDDIEHLYKLRECLQA